MNRDKPNGLEDVDNILHELESLRSQLVDLEAMAHAAARALEHIPPIPRAPAARQSPPYDEEMRHNLGRLQALVTATADSARAVLENANQALDNIHELQARHGSGSGNGSRVSEPGPRYPWPALGHQPHLLHLGCGNRQIRGEIDTPWYKLLAQSLPSGD